MILIKFIKIGKADENREKNREANMERTATGVRDIHGDMIYADDILKIKGQYTGEIFRQHERWLVAVETFRFMFPVTILPLTTAVDVYKAERKKEK